MLQKLKSRRFTEGGQTLAEFGLILPLIAIIIFGLVDASRMLQTYVTIQESARAGARYAVTGRIDCTGIPIQNRNNCIVAAVNDRASGLTNNSTVSTSFRSWAYPSYSTVTANSAGNQCDAVEVRVDYNYKPITPFFKYIVSNVPLKATERMVNEPFGTCS